LIITKGSKYSFQLPTKDSTPTVARIGRDNGIVICQNMRGVTAAVDESRFKQLTGQFRKKALQQYDGKAQVKSYLRQDHPPVRIQEPQVAHAE